MKRKNKFVCTLLIGCMLMTACSNTAATEEATTTIIDEVSTETVSTAAQANVATTLIGQIQAIDGTTITIASMNMSVGEIPSGEKPADDAQAPAGEKPADDAQAPAGEKPADGGQAPSGERPADGGQAPAGDMPQMEDMQTTDLIVSDTTPILDESGNAISLSDLNAGDMITIEFDENGNVLSVSLSSMQMGMGAPGNSQSAPSSYDAVNTYASDTSIRNEVYLSTGIDENVILVSDGATVDLEQVTISRNSEESTGGDSSSFYGIGASILVTDGTVNISNSTIESDAPGAAGVFAYGDGVANVSDTIITTQENTSGGIHVAGGGTLHATNLTVETNGESAAAVRSDRGGGTMTVNGGTYTSNGIGSPAVYCTADITIEDADLIATGSEAVCIEGLNSLSLTNCNLSGNMPEQSQNDCTWTVILYQSMSGDSEIGNSTFTMNGGTLTSQNGGLFYTTNTESTFYLSQVDITYSDSNDFFLKCTGNANERGWGSTGANGADCIFTADTQDMTGNIIWDSISTLDFKMTNNSTLIGAFLQDESCAGNGGDGYANVTIDENSTWIVTGDSVLTNLINRGTIEDEHGNVVTIKDENGTVLVNGTSTYTITVSSYTS